VLRTPDAFLELATGLEKLAYDAAYHRLVQGVDAAARGV
jgi:hypothetical protein